MKLTVREIAEGASVLAGRRGLGRQVRSPQLLKPDLSVPSSWRGVAGSVLYVTPGQIDYYCSLQDRERRRVASALLKKGPACVVVVGKLPCRELLDRAEVLRIPVLKSRGIPRVVRLLVERLTPRMSVHGVLVEVFGIGTLITGESAIGKSETALDLVLRGHKLVADDSVILEKDGDLVRGRPAELGVDLLQIRGLGIINIRALYGETAVTAFTSVELVVEMEEWQQGHHYSLLGLRERRYRILGRNIPYVKLPIKPGRTMATLIEVAARNQMLKKLGIYTARDLNRKLNTRLDR